MLPVACWVHSFFIKTNFIGTTRLDNHQNINKHLKYQDQTEFSKQHLLNSIIYFSFLFYFRLIIVCLKQMVWKSIKYLLWHFWFTIWYVTKVAVHFHTNKQNVHIFFHKNIQTEKKEKYKKQAVELYLEPCQISVTELWSAKV